MKMTRAQLESRLGELYAKVDSAIDAVDGLKSELKTIRETLEDDLPSEDDHLELESEEES